MKQRLGEPAVAAALPRVVDAGGIGRYPRCRVDSREVPRDVEAGVGVEKFDDGAHGRVGRLEEARVVNAGVP